MQQKEKFGKFAEGEGQQAKDGAVTFGQDGVAAQSFRQKADEAGFQTLLWGDQTKWIHGKEDWSDAPKEWRVVLV